MKTILTSAALALAVAGAADAEAQTVYRCGSTYSSTPCEGGKTVDVADPRNGEQVKASREQSKRDAKLGRELQADRERAETANARADAALGKAIAAHARAREKQRDDQINRQRQLAGGYGAGAPPSQGGSKRKRGCVPSDKIRCPEFVAVEPAPAKK